MNRYKHITLYERELISVGLEKKKSLRHIAKELKRSHTSVSREIKRNKLYAPKPAFIEQPYIACKAHQKARERGVYQRSKAPLKDPLIFVYAREHLRPPYNWSPETIAGRLSIDHPGHTIDDETIYRYIYGVKQKRMKLWKHLRRHRKKRMKKNGRKVAKYARLATAIPIGERPDTINKRKRIGDWETDNMEGKRSDKTAVSVTVDRMSRRVCLKKLIDHKASTKASVLIDQFTTDTARSMTVDRGPENSNHDEVSQGTGIATYACEPYHSWEKGTVENTIGRLRWRIPKGTSVDPITQQQLSAIEKWMNATPRKCLQYLTPNEFHEKIQSTS
jgi:transposase, IS30 family